MKNEITDRELDRFYGECEDRHSPPVGECDRCGDTICAETCCILPDGRIVCRECMSEVFVDEFLELPPTEQAEIVGARIGLAGD